MAQPAIAIDYGEPARADIGVREWEARVQLAACYRIFDHLGWTELIYNHITLRVPGADEHFLINPFGLHYSEVTASNLVKVDLDGTIVGPSAWPINPAGYTPHSTIHRHVPDARCVMHTHTTAGLAVACTKGGLSWSNFYAAQLHGMVAYHAFEGITLNPDEGPRMLASLGDKPILILRNHGLLAIGETLPQAFARLWTIQRACEIQMASASLNDELLEIPEPVLAECTRRSLQFDPKYGAGVDVFNALLRQVDRVDRSYRN